MRKLTRDQHTEPFKGPFSITRVHPGKILSKQNDDTAFGPFSTIDHAVMKKGLTIKMHEHVNDEILSYVWKGKMYHRDSAGIEVAVTPGNLMMMNAGKGFWHEEKVKEAEVEMLQIFVRPNETDLTPNIQFHEKPDRNRDWYLMVGPENSNAPLHVRQNVYIYDAHPLKNDQLDVPHIEGYAPFLYVMDGEMMIDEIRIEKQEAITQDKRLVPLTANEDSTILLFLVDMNAPMSLAGTISGKQK